MPTERSAASTDCPACVDSTCTHGDGCVLDAAFDTELAVPCQEPERSALVDGEGSAAYVPREGDPIVLLADAVNQLGMVVEEIAQRTTWGGYVIESKARRRDWIERVRHEREHIAELIPQ